MIQQPYVFSHTLGDLLNTELQLNALLTFITFLRRLECGRLQIEVTELLTASGKEPPPSRSHLAGTLTVAPAAEKIQLEEQLSFAPWPIPCQYGK